METVNAIKMKEVTWDYKGPENSVVNSISFWTQKNWNQTLITKINQIGAQIHQSTHMGGPNKIKINEKLLPLLNELEYFKVNEDGGFTLSGRFDIIIDNTISKDIILLYLENDNLLKAKEFNKTFCVENVKKDGFFTEINFSILENESVEYNSALYNPDKKLLTDKELSGIVKVLNYE